VAPTAEEPQILVPVVAWRVVQVRDGEHHADTPRILPLGAE
jgi:hypothetical protein